MSYHRNIKLFTIGLQLLLIIFSSQLIAQNLIPNAGFEYYNSCPDYSWHFAPIARGWMNPTKGTPDFYHPCGEKEYRTPKNRYGNKKPYHGDAYIGINNRGYYREYVSIRLKEPLKKGLSYKVKMYVNASDSFNHTCSDIGFYFSSKKVRQSNTQRLQDAEAQVINPIDSIIPTDRWKEISGQFIAKGGEQFVTIGSFRKVSNFQKIIKNKGERINSYIYIDNLSTTLLERPKYKLPAKGKIKLLDHVYFQLNKAVLLSASYSELNKLATILKDNSQIKIEIIGHTDNSGSADYNLQLSEKRAQAVANYLNKKGITKNRVQYKGEGSKLPMVKNESIKDRQLNRRVEFKIVD